MRYAYYCEACATKGSSFPAPGYNYSDSIPTKCERCGCDNIIAIEHLNVEEFRSLYDITDDPKFIKYIIELTNKGIDPQEDLNISLEELSTLCSVSPNPQFIESMIELKQNNIIEYEIRMSEIRNMNAQREDMSELVEHSRGSGIPTCPNCHSENISSISGVERAASVFMLGMFSKKINKSFKCNSCGYTW